ncbi:hypothetical protein DY000_02036485 [Brassica cretica]|uniref:Protein kinase domain-containing protein n=1 Tax=Brassica cretica TaxID=69181 RepID=A0ABQ7BDN3_BRACR|nr:hypothetical protein DY000_02036485 [Brassica cretica]
MGLFLSCLSSPSSSNTGLHTHASTNNHSDGINFSSSTSTTAATTNTSVGQSQFSEAVSESSGGVMSYSGQILASPNLKVYSFADLVTATKNFKPESMLGQGGFGKVYRGWIDAKTLAPSKVGSEE